MNKPNQAITGMAEIALRVHDLDLMRRFYEQVIGLEVLREIKDSNGYLTLGYIETMPDGKQRALDKNGYATLGYYDPGRNVTLDANGYATLATGNVLSALIYQAR